VETSLRYTKWTGEAGLYELTLHCTGHDRHHLDKMIVQRVIALCGSAAVPGHLRPLASPIAPARRRDFFRQCGIRFAEEKTAPYNFARIPTAKPLSTGGEATLLTFINGKTTCSINQPHNPPPVPLARWPVFVLSNLPASDLAPLHA
jgi:hypothetical protein